MIRIPDGALGTARLGRTSLWTCATMHLGLESRLSGGPAWPCPEVLDFSQTPGIARWFRRLKPVLRTSSPGHRLHFITHVPIFLPVNISARSSFCGRGLHALHTAGAPQWDTGVVSECGRPLPLFSQNRTHHGKSEKLAERLIEFISPIFLPVNFSAGSSLF